jgi:hypothetical protein
MEAPRPHRPLPIRAINAAGALTSRLGLRLPSLREQDLLDAARKQSGLGDFGHDGFRAGLHELLESLEREAQLSTIGRTMARGQILSTLVNRLQLVEHRKRHPEIAQQQIERPLFVLGLPRTGTTILYGLLAQDPAHRSPMSWEVACPCPPPRPETYESDSRIERMDRELEQLRKLAPGFDAIHPMAARLPQECVAITAMDFHSVQFGASYNVPSYEEWLFEQDLRPSYRWHYRFLQHLQSEYARERWVLKSPGHLPFIDVLLEIYPDAMIVQTHRDPLDVLASVSSLECVLRNAASDAVDPLELGRQQVALWSHTLERGMAQRKLATQHADQFCDVHFPDLLADPLACVRQIYQHFDLELGEEAEKRMSHFLEDNRRDKHGTHQYTLETFGIDPLRDARGFDAYCERYGVVRRKR